MAQSPDTNIIQQAAIQNKPGVSIEYESWATTYAYRPPVREDYTIKILETWKGGITFRYLIKQSTLGEVSGNQTLTSLDDCTSLDPWWEPDKVEFDGHCQLWIPAKKLTELKVENKTYLPVDTVVRHDSVVRWDFQKKLEYPCEIDNQTVLLKAVKAKTSREDEVVILDDPDNPLILSIKSTNFSWRVVKISN